MGHSVLKGIKILIVEDDYASRLYLNKVLEKAGASVYNAMNGQEAVDMANINSDFEIILMDLQLPVMDGYTSTRLIREFNKNVIIIAQTAYGLIGERDKIFACGFNDYIVKPILSENLLENLLSHLRNKR